MAKAQKEIQVSDVLKLAKLQCTAREAAAFLNIRVGTFNRLLQKDEVIRDAWERGKALGFISLRRKQHALARDNATMAIFLGKQYLGQKDVQGHEIADSDGKPINFDNLRQKERDDLRLLIDKGSSGSEDKRGA